MLSVHGYYENGVCVPTETLKLAGKRLEVIKTLSGILPSSITDEEVKNDFAVEN